MLPSRPRRFEPPWPQAGRGTQFPLFTAASGPRPQWVHPRVSQRRRRYSEPPWPQIVTPAAVVNQWAATFAQPGVFGITPPALQSTVVALTPATSVGSGTGTPSSGNWLFCIAGWNQDGLPAATVADADDIHSFWRPGDVWLSDWAVSQAGGNTRTSVWYTPNLARVPGDVYCAPNGAMAGMAVTVLEVSGLGPWDAVTGIFTNYAAAATALNLALPAPPAAAFLLAAVTGDSSAAGQAFAPSGWTALATVTASNGADHTCDAVLTSACISTSGSVSVNATASSATDLSGVIIGVLQAAPSPIPAGANPAWPGRAILEAAYGSGFETPPDQHTWTRLTDPAWASLYAPGMPVKRFWSWDETSQIQYQLGGPQATEGTSQLDNLDAALSPWNPGSPFYSTALNVNMSFNMVYPYQGVLPWAGNNNAALAQSAAHSFASAQGVTAAFSMEVTPDGVTAFPGALSEPVPVTAGDAYSVSAWFYSAAGWSTGCQVGFEWLNSGGGVISLSGGTVVAVPAATWTQAVALNVTAPAGAVHARIITQFSGTPAAPFWVAEAGMAAGTSPVTTGLVAAGTPVRVRMALGTIGGVPVNRWYTWQRNALKWPEERSKSLRNYVPLEFSDIWSAVSASCPSPYRGEIRQDAPGWWWPADDQPLDGGVQPTSLRNAAAGSTTRLQVYPQSGGVPFTDAYSTTGTDVSTGGIFGSKYGQGNAPVSMAVYQAGALQGWMYGDPQSSAASYNTGNPVTASPGSAAFQVTGLGGNTGTQGWFLAATGTFPPLAAGASVTVWWNAEFLGTATGITASTSRFDVAGQPPAPITLATLATASAPVMILQLDTSGHLQLITYSGGTGTSHAIYTASDLRSASWHSVTVTATQSAWTVYVDGGLNGVVSGTGAGMTSAWDWIVYGADMGTAGGSSLGSAQHMANIALSHMQVYTGILPAWRVLAHYCAAICGFGLLPAPQGLTLADCGQDLAGASYVPDGSAFNGSYANTNTGSGSVYSFSAVAVAVAGSYTSGPSARATRTNTYPGSSTHWGYAVWAAWTSLSASVAVYTSSAANTETHAAVTAGSGDAFTAGYGSGATGVGVCQTGSGTGASPPTGPTALGDTVQQRLERVLGYGLVTWPGRAIDAASLLVQAALDVGGQQTGANLTSIVQSDDGWLFVDSNGTLCYRSRPHLNADTVVWAIGMNTAAGQYPFKDDIQYSTDQTKVMNVIQVTPYSPDGAVLAEIVPQDAAAVDASQQQYGVRPSGGATTSYLQSTSEIQAQANWKFAAYGYPQRRITQLTVDAASHPVSWPFIAGANIGDLITVYDAPLGQPATTGTYRISSLKRTLSYGANGQQVAGRAVIAADPVPQGGFWT